MGCTASQHVGGGHDGGLGGGAVAARRAPRRGLMEDAAAPTACGGPPPASASAAAAAGRRSKAPPAPPPGEGLPTLLGGRPQAARALSETWAAQKRAVSAGLAGNLASAAALAAAGGGGAARAGGGGGSAVEGRASEALESKGSFVSLDRRSSRRSRPGELEKCVEATCDLVQTCGPQTPGHRRVAATMYEMECRNFPRHLPKAAAAYARLAGELHDANRLAAGAFAVGLAAGLADASIDPAAACRRLRAEDWGALEQAIRGFISHRAVALCDCTFEPEDEGMVQEMLAEFPSTQARAEAFLEALKSLAETLLLRLQDLRRSIPEVAGPLAMLRNIVERCTVPDERAVVAAFHMARKGERKSDLAAIHFLSAAWQREPRGAVQCHHMGMNLGIVCWAIIDV